jgi:hypothetical protein
MHQLRFVCFLLFLMACRKTGPTIQPPDEKILAVSAINQRIFDQLKETGEVDWSCWDDPSLWSAIVQSDSIVAVGYQPIGFREDPGWISNIDLNSAGWKDARGQVLRILPKDGWSGKEVWPEKVLPVVVLHIRSFFDLQRLRRSSLVRYIEPMGYDRHLANTSTQLESSSGCGSNTPTWEVQAGVHYTTIAPAAKQSWNYPGHGIPAAWNRTTGRGVKIFLIDTGSSSAQDNLGVAFNSGASYGRTLERIVTLPQNSFLGVPIGSPETAEDACGHGTSMAGAMAAPRCSDGNAVGIAYNCNLITCRAASDVFLDESRELKGVVDGFTNAANRTDVRIISMSMGRVTSSSYLRDAVRYAYGKGKLIFCAAGTSTDWTAGWTGVIFPASLPEVQAVTGVKDLGALTACEVCHKGPEVDFVVTMERAADGMHPLSLANYGDWPTTVGGSSVATASMAGMAALVWSRFASLTRDQLVIRLQQFSSHYPYRTTSYGWGRLNVDGATR